MNVNADFSTFFPYFWGKGVIYRIGNVEHTYFNAVCPYGDVQPADVGKGLLWFGREIAHARHHDDPIRVVGYA